MNELPKLVLPDSLNYVGAFLTMACNLSCDYCINKIDRSMDRNTLYSPTNSKTLNPSDWAQIFNRIPVREDLPITLQGGEPMMYHKGMGIGKILDHCEHWFDLLTNFALTPENFMRNLNGNEKKLMRGQKMNLPYQSIRVSYHADEMNRTWKNGIDELVRRCEALREYGFNVSADKSKTDVCIYMVEHPSNKLPVINGDVYFEAKPFLGNFCDMHKVTKFQFVDLATNTYTPCFTSGDFRDDAGSLYGDYAYPHSTDLVARGFHPVGLDCECRTTELLIDPLGFVWDCHFHLYDHWLGNKKYQPLGNMLDPSFNLDVLKKWHPCSDYGKCIGCDTKVKNNRFQNLMFRGIPHTSVEIKNIKFPKGLP
jgi:organic radical activating enzyme